MSSPTMAKCRFVVAAAGSVLWLWMPFGAARSETLPRIGVITPAPASSLLEGALREGLREHGYIEGKNILVEWRRSPGTGAELRALADALARSNVDVIVAVGTPETRAALDATTRIPIAFQAGDPVGLGLVKSLARPGGNATGVSTVSPDLTAKRLELLHELAPRARRVAFLGNSSNPVNVRHSEEAHKAARALGLALDTFDARNARELDGALAAIQHSKPDGFIVTADLLFVGEKARIVEAVRKSRLPTVFPYREFHDDGALMSYGYSIGWVTRRTAGYVDKILRGASPSELPIEQLTKFELVVNLKTAKAFGLKIPESILLRADEVIR